MKVQVVKDFLDVPEELPRLPPGKQNVPTMYDRLKEIRGRIFLRGENCKTLEFMKFDMVSKIKV